LGIEVIFKRDDLTGSTLTGNKVRKLEYLLAEASDTGCNMVVTCGGEQSNHCRATAIAAARLGLGSLLLLRTDDPAHPPPATANILLDRIAGSEIRWVSRAEYQRRADLFVEVKTALTKRGLNPYLVPEGGSNALGAWGYVRCVEELVEQLGNEPLTVVYAAGSGGTGAGLILGTKLMDLPWRIVGFNVCDDQAYFVRAIGEIVESAIKRWSLPVAFERSEVEIVDGYVGLGYAKSQTAELKTLVDLARLEGVVLDPVYTGKAYHGLLGELQREPNRFGRRIVFIHTGGIFGLLAKADEIAPLL
jgi:D-cysteine desulfhydrase